MGLALTDEAAEPDVFPLIRFSQQLPLPDILLGRIYVLALVLVECIASVNRVRYVASYFSPKNAIFFCPPMQINVMRDTC